MTISFSQAVGGQTFTGQRDVTAYNANDGRNTFNACAVSSTISSNEALTSFDVMDLIELYRAAAKEHGVSNTDFLIFIANEDGARKLESTNGGRDNHIFIPRGTSELIIKMEFGSQHDTGRAEAIAKTLNEKLKTYKPKVLALA